MVIDNKLVEINGANAEKYIRERHDGIYQRVKKLFLLANENAAGNNQVSVDSFKKYFLPRVKIENCNTEIDRRNFYDQSNNESIEPYGDVRKVLTGQGDDYTTGCLLDFASFSKELQTNCI